MRIELELEGRPVQFVGLNRPNGVSLQAELVNVCSFPLWQDVPEVGVNGALGFQKDDLIVLDRSGAIRALFRTTPTGVVDLSTPEAYEQVKEAILSVG